MDDYEDNENMWEFIGSYKLLNYGALKNNNKKNNNIVNKNNKNIVF